MDGIRRRHEELKKRIHAFRVPINSRAGIFMMSCVYFTTPIIIGYGLYELTQYVSKKNLGENGEFLAERKRAWIAESNKSRAYATTDKKDGSAVASK